MCSQVSPPLLLLPMSRCSKSTISFCNVAMRARFASFSLFSLSLDLSDMCNMLKSAVYPDGHADGAFRVTHDRLVSASEELLRRAKEAPGADVEAYIQCSAILLHLSKQVRADDPAIVP